MGDEHKQGKNVYIRKKSMIRKLVDDEAGLCHWYSETLEHHMEGLHNSNEVKFSNKK